MPLVDVHDMLNHAYRNHYAVGGFSVTNLDFLAAIVAAAERCRSPVILNLADASSTDGRFEPLIAAAERVGQSATVPVAVQFECSPSLESSVRAINLGCNGVSASAETQSFPALVAHVRRVVEVAHACGVAVEGKLDALHSNENEDTPTPVDEARAFVQRTRVDSLAVTLCAPAGRVRGRVKLDVERLKRLNEALQIPLTVQAGAGLGDEQCHKLIQHGVAKITVGTSLTEIAAGHLRAKMRSDARGSFDSLVDGLSSVISAEAERCLHLMGSAGRAAEVLVQCRPWRPVQHVIVYNVEGATDVEVESMMARGRDILGRIPGVRRVFSGWAIPKTARYRCCWLVEFVNAKVIDSYRDHPDHTAFANHLFRPLAGDRISIDFAEADDQMNAIAAIGNLRARA